jgi:hypothetical protein
MDVQTVNPVNTPITIPAKILLEPTTDADTTVEFTVLRGQVIPVVAYGLGASETIAIEIYTPSGYVAYKANGVSIGMSADINKIGFDIPGRYRLNKPITAAPVGVLRDVS